jgi:hypothetical protein
MRFARNLWAIWSAPKDARFTARSLTDEGWSVWDRKERRFLNRREIAKLTAENLNERCLPPQSRGSASG